MTNNDILRLALVLGGNTAQNFMTNLRKIVKLVLFDNYGTPIKISEILSCISKQFSLEFSDVEVYQSINGARGILVTRMEDYVESLYCLTPEEYQKLKEKQKTNIDVFIKKFLNENKLIELSFDETKDLVYRFLYFTFNSDAKTVLKLLNKTEKNEEEYCVSDEFNSSESALINAFLNWDNPGKNEYILNMISACFDYCMLTVKKDTSSFMQVFNGKEFFLDSNIIFRLAGFNKQERKAVLDAFIKKCKDANIKICYTNQTKEEIKTTIKYYVDVIKKLLGKSHPISMSAMQALSSKYANLDFYEQYETWCKDERNVAGDYESFEKYLERKVEKVLFSFTPIVSKEYNTFTNKKAFGELVEDFKAYKNEKYKNTYEGAIRVDINNYLFMNEKNCDGQAASFLELKYYFITADHCLTEWASKKRPGTVPIFVLPSVWYSILLKYKGRTEEDYKSFCHFLNIRIAPEKDPLIRQKQAMLAYVLELNEDRDIKEEIIFDIESRLQSDNITIENPIEFVDESHKTVLQEKLDQSDIKHKEEIDILRKETEKLHKDELKKIYREHDKEKKDVHSQGYSEGRDSVISSRASEIARRNECIIICFNIFFFIFVAGVIFVFATFVFKDKEFVKKLPEWYQDYSVIIGIFNFLISILIKIAEKIIKTRGFLSVDEDKIIQKLKKKYNREKISQ